MRVEMKGIFKVTAKGRAYYYAWRGGPRLRGEPGSHEFKQSYDEAVAARKVPDDGRFRALVTLYKAGAAYGALAESTKTQWSPWLDRVRDYFGELRIEQFGRADKIRPFIRQWRNRYAGKPRTADYGMQVLSRVLAHGVEIGRIGLNPCEGIKPLYSADRSDRIWTEADIAQIKAAASSEIGFAVDLAAATGFRLGDLLSLSWSHVGEHEITIVTSKSGKRRREAIVPLYDDLRALLGTIPKRSTAVLTNSRHLPWTTDGFGSSFNKAKIRAGMKGDDDLNFHDLRGTAATRFYQAGLSERIIAEIMGWEEEHVSRIIRRYVGRAAATRAAILQLNSRGADSAKLLQNRPAAEGK